MSTPADSGQEQLAGLPASFLCSQKVIAYIEPYATGNLRGARLHTCSGAWRPELGHQNLTDRSLEVARMWACVSADEPLVGLAISVEDADNLCERECISFR